MLIDEFMALNVLFDTRSVELTTMLLLINEFCDADPVKFELKHVDAFTKLPMAKHPVRFELITTESLLVELMDIVNALVELVQFAIWRLLAFALHWLSVEWLSVMLSFIENSLLEF